ncbi:MAG: sigma-70 family RNA polymerase sigma factor [Acidobacteriia bacterium]|nr:sigma-70 family RNA polymerase sigma factor [Terriglobia bacterium]
MSPQSEADEELLERVRSGDEQAFVALYRRRQGTIFRFLLHMTGSVNSAEDVTQEVFLILLRDKCSYDPLRGTVAGYLFGIARKLVLRHLERNRALAEHGLEDFEGTLLPVLAVDADPMVDLMRREGLDQLQRAILALPKRYREVVVLCDLEEMDYLAAAEFLNCPVGTVRSRLHRARALLLDKLRQRVEPRLQVKTLKPARSLL